MLEKMLTLGCIAFGVFLITVHLPELLYYAAPVHVVAYTVGLLLGGAGVRAILKG